MSLSLRDMGIASAYATVGVGDVEKELANAANAVQRIRAGKDRTVISKPETIFLLGQADIAAVFQTTNFRRVFDLRYPSADSSASVVNWVFSVPYAVGRKGAPQPGFRFIIHLRLRRSAYAFRGIEELVIMKLQQFLGDDAKDARVHAGLGWSDLIIDGIFTPRTFKAFARFIISIHGLQVRFGPEGEKRSLPVLQRMLTLIGYSGEPPQFKGNRHLTFLRAKPGRYDEIVERLKEDGHAGTVYMLDGKADFMLVTNNTKPKWLAKQRELGSEKHRDALRKVETHLMYFAASEFLKAGKGDRLIIDTDEAFDRDHCGCRDLRTAWVKDIVPVMDSLGGLLRDGQRHAIDNTLFLLATALRDSSICCDARDAVAAAYDTLHDILVSIGRVKTESADPLEQYSELMSLWRRLDEWHRFSELLLRQRTVGSYEEILGQSDRSVVYSGGVQKFLYLADQLVAEFARRIDPETPLRLATMYDSVKTILGLRIGVIRVPTSKIFNFPFVVSDLWHEVAGAYFFLRYGKEVAKRLPPHLRTVFLEKLADHYADLQVFLMGFGADFPRFVTSLLHGWKLTYGDVDELVKRISVGELLVRIYLVYEFRALREVQNDEARAAEFLTPKKAQELVTELADYLRTNHPSLHVSETDVANLRANVVRRDFSDFHRALYQPLLRVPAWTTSGDLRPFLRGEVAALEDTHDLNDLFAELWYHLATTPKKSGAFRAMAALGKSAAIEFHRRQVWKRERYQSSNTAGDRKVSSQAADPDKTPVMSRDTDVAEDPFKPGKKIKRWKIIRPLDAGMMGEVYVAYDGELKEQVALKFAKGWEMGGVRERMIQEARIGRSVRHENVCGIHDANDWRGRPFLVMELVDGETLEDVIKRMAPVSKTRGADLAQQLLSGLVAMHEKEPPVLHRDIKPANVMLDRRGKVRIMDLGLAILENAAAAAEFAGTPLYMAPEVRRGMAASPESDVYSAGLILFELFTGIRVGELNGVPVLEAWNSAPERRRLGKPIDELITQSLDPDPSKRGTARALRDRWKKITEAGRSRPAAPAGSPRRK
jgi:hypothetical protein